MNNDQINQSQAFKAYDIRGKYPQEINEGLSYKIGKAFCTLLNAKKVVVGHDIRNSSQSLSNSLIRGLTETGCQVIDIGMCGTEMVYFATPFFDADGGIMITASHNPKEYNGMKFVRRNSIPISGDSGLNKIKELVSEIQNKNSVSKKSKTQTINIYDEYAKFILKFIDINNLRPLKIVCNAGNGIGGRMLDSISKNLPFQFIKIFSEPDGNFPNGVPNPLLPENRLSTTKAVLENKADIGIAWDGDADRCFLYDENGNFIEGYYIVGLLAKFFLQKNPGEKIIHDPRLFWNTREIINSFGGKAIMSKTGHAFIKERMRSENAIYGGEMSAHHYFRDFYYCDSGMIPWLLITELLSKSGQHLSEMVRESENRFPISGEINSKVKDSKAVIDKIEKKYNQYAKEIDYTDGLSIDMGEWRFNVRSSNTEPLLRLNVETKGDKVLLKKKTDELLNLIRDNK